MQSTSQISTDEQKAFAKKHSTTQQTMAWRIAGLSLVFCIVLVPVIFYLIAKLVDAQAAVQHNTKVIYVRMMPNGEHQVTFDAGDQEDRMTQPVVNASLINYVTRRNQRHRETIKADFGFALTYLSQVEANKFLKEEEGMGAAEFAADYAQSAGAPRVDIEIRAIDHELWVRGDSPTDGSVFKSVVYFRKIVREASTGRAAPAENKIKRLEWRFAPLPAVLDTPRTIELLSANPLGIEIITEVEMDDLPS